MAWIETQHHDAPQQQRALLDVLVSQITHALDQHGTAVLALAGGRTPLPLYRALAAEPLDWTKISVVPTDERWVSVGHPARNLSQISDCFAAAKGVRLLPLVPAEARGAPHRDTAARTLGAVAEPFSAVLLGMGLDGHTASLFAGAPGLDAALDPDGRDDAVVIHPQSLPPDAPFPRISLSVSRLIRAERVLLLINGAEKLRVLQRAQACPDPSQLPIAALLQSERLRVEIHWSP